MYELLLPTGIQGLMKNKQHILQLKLVNIILLIPEPAALCIHDFIMPVLCFSHLTPNACVTFLFNNMSLRNRLKFVHSVHKVPKFKPIPFYRQHPNIPPLPPNIDDQHHLHIYFTNNPHLIENIFFTIPTQ